MATAKTKKANSQEARATVSGLAYSSEPQYAHDCDQCAFLGHFDGYDIYICGDGPNTTILGRSDNPPSGYSSLPFRVLRTLSSPSELLGNPPGWFKSALLGIGWHLIRGQ